MNNLIGRWKLRNGMIAEITQYDENNKKWKGIIAGDPIKYIPDYWYSNGNHIFVSQLDLVRKLPEPGEYVIGEKK